MLCDGSLLFLKLTLLFITPVIFSRERKKPVGGVSLFPEDPFKKKADSEKVQERICSIGINPYPVNIFVLKMLSAHYIGCLFKCSPENFYKTEV